VPFPAVSPCSLCFGGAFQFTLEKSDVQAGRAGSGFWSTIVGLAIPSFMRANMRPPEAEYPVTVLQPLALLGAVFVAG
jgi:hypothetical protein